jgi:hypothetical protein
VWPACQSDVSDTARKAIAFFLEAAKEAGIKTSPYFKKTGVQVRGVRKPVANSRSNTKPTETARVKTTPPEKSANSGGSGGNGVESMDRAQLLLSKFPSFDPAWPDDVKSKWFDAFDKLMGRQARRQSFMVRRVAPLSSQFADGRGITARSKNPVR